MSDIDADRLNLATWASRLKHGTSFLSAPDVRFQFASAIERLLEAHADARAIANPESEPAQAIIEAALRLEDERQRHFRYRAEYTYAWGNLTRAVNRLRRIRSVG